MTLSPQQLTIIDWLTNSIGHLLIRARAGCGKSTTLLELTKAFCKLFPSKSVLLTVFGKEASNDLQNKLSKAGIKGYQASAGTFHSNALAAWAAHCRPVNIYQRIDGDKCKKLLDAELDRGWDALKPKDKNPRRIKMQPYRAAILNLVSLAKADAFGVTGKEQGETRVNPNF